MATQTATRPIQRNRPIQPKPEFRDILREEETFATGAEDNSGERINRWFDELMLQSGTHLAPSSLLLSMLIAGVALGAWVFVLQENFLTTAVAACGGFLLPLVVMMVIRSRRKRTLQRQMPGLVDELARAARTGRSLEQCLSIVAEDTPAPLGTEFELVARRLDMGLGVESAIRDLPRRTGLTSMNVLVVALNVHVQSGGDLVLLLERLARTIRDRLAYLGRLKVATTASRATAIMMLIVPPLVLAFFTFRDPEYLTTLFDTPWGRTTTIAAFALQIIGTVWVLRILKTSERG